MDSELTQSRAGILNDLAREVELWGRGGGGENDDDNYNEKPLLFIKKEFSAQGTFGGQIGHLCPRLLKTALAKVELGKDWWVFQACLGEGGLF